MLEKNKPRPLPSTVSPEEIEKFSALAEAWWNPEGAFRPLHQMNPLRLGYIRDKVLEAGGVLAGARVLDVGCGGGLLAEPLTRLGAHVTAIDASEKNIAIAAHHAEKEGLSIEYRFTTAEDLLAGHLRTGQSGFDVVTAMEIIEHVADVPAFLTTCAGLVRPGGLLFVSTLNRTAKAYLVAILGAEYVLRLLPKGTHEWKKFLLPSELITEAESNALSLVSLDGFTYRPLTQKWGLSRDVRVNYAACFKKTSLG